MNQSRNSSIKNPSSVSKKTVSSYLRSEVDSSSALKI